MKNKIAIFTLLGFGIWSLGFVGGCGTSSTTSSSSSGSVDSAYVGMAQAGTVVASGGSSMGNSATAVGQMSSQQLSTSSLKIREEGPPNSFFETIPVNGWLTVTSETGGGNIVPYMRIKNKAGTVITSEALIGKKLFKLTNLTWKQIMSSRQDISLEVVSFIQAYMMNPSSAYASISTMGEYYAWALMIPSMEAMMRGRMPISWPTEAKLSTPEAKDSEKIGVMELKMAFTKNATGEVVLTVPTESSGKPTAGKSSGTGSITFNGVTYSASVEVTFSSSGPPSSVSITLIASDGKQVVITIDPTTGTGSGTLKDSSGNTLGTIDASSTGGSVTVGGTKQTFTL